MENKYDFVAIDFENADNNQFVCQIGIAAIKNNIIIEELEILIQPPGNKYGFIQQQIHHITPETTEKSPTLDMIWDNIKHFFENQTLIMHKAPTDIAILHKSLSYYFLPIPKYTYFDTCTELGCGKSTLDILAKTYDVILENHHNALCDAKATALIWIKHINGYNADLNVFEKSKKEPKNKLFVEKKIDKELLVKDLSKADENNPFYDRIVVITGDFSIARSELAKKLKLMGADVNSSISKKTHYVLVGKNPGPSKMDTINKLKYDGFNITLIYENDLEKIFSGDFTNYLKEKQTSKNLKITLDHIYSFQIQIDCINLFANKEFFISKSIETRNQIYQLIGFLGALTNEDIDNTTDIILISKKSVKNIENGIPDDDISYIEDMYNNRKSVNFKFVLLTENDFHNYYSHRMKTSHKNDNVVMDVFLKISQKFNP